MSDTELERRDDALPAVPDDMVDIGLEDFDSSDYVMPRLNIEHTKALFVDNLSGEEYDALTVILLGLVKQRILWDDDVKDGDRPLCKSFNFREGHPDEDRFPWKTSGFDRATFGNNDEIVLPCEACSLKEWGTNPSGDTPWCSEQHTFPLLMEVPGGWAPALLTVQRSAIKASKAYLTSFARSRTPLYTVQTQLTLQAQKRGSVNYAVPKFVRGDETERDQWAFYADNYRRIREFVTTPPVRNKDEKEPEAPRAGEAPAAKAADDDDDLPF